MRSGRLRCFSSGLLAGLAVLVWSSLVLADGGTLRLSEQQGGYQLAVFTSPAPLRAGPVDISALIQDATTQEPATDVRVTIEAVHRSQPRVVIRRPATHEAATNKLLHAAAFDLGTAGWWDIRVHIEGPLGKAESGFEVEVAPPLPQYLVMWPWLAWPLVPIVLFGTQQFFVRRSRTLSGERRADFLSIDSPLAADEPVVR